jgi:hypothetical protein
MKFGARFWTCAIGASLMAACQQGAGPANNGAEAAGNGANAQAPASAPAAAANTAAPQTGPVALASDSALPAPCQTVVREVQTCIDHLSGDEKAFREDWLRTSLNSSRQTWASAYDDSYRGPVCAQDLQTLHSRTATWNCGVR